VCQDYPHLGLAPQPIGLISLELSLAYPHLGHRGDRLFPEAPLLGIKWESNAHNCFPQDPTRRTERPTLNYETVLDDTRQTGARGFLNRVSEVRVLPGAPILISTEQPLAPGLTDCARVKSAVLLAAPRGNTYGIWPRLL